jgi:serine/threonine protein kinase
LWPVATCDLASLLEDADWLQKQVFIELGLSPSVPGAWNEHNVDGEARLQALGILIRNQTEATRDSAEVFLRQTIGCIANAVAYLHASDIKHKDLKPSNIVLSRDGLWLTDFGTATDFSVLSSSVTENGERGTPKYFAPEVANFTPSGRSADIFAMGCVFFEIMTLCAGYTLDLSQNLRQSNDKSFQSNLGAINAWFDEHDRESKEDASTIDDCFLGLVGWMMDEEAAVRPTADIVEKEITLIHGLRVAFCEKVALSHDPSFYRTCCHPEILYSQ